MKTKYAALILGLGTAFATMGCDPKDALTAADQAAAVSQDSTLKTPSTVVRQDISNQETFEVDKGKLESDGVSSAVPFEIVSYKVINSKGKPIDDSVIEKVESGGSIESLKIDFNSLGVGIYKVEVVLQNKAGDTKSINYRVYQTTGAATSKGWPISVDGRCVGYLYLAEAMKAGLVSKKAMSIDSRSIELKDAKGGAIRIAALDENDYDKDGLYDAAFMASSCPIGSGSVTVLNSDKSTTKVLLSFGAEAKAAAPAAERKAAAAAY